VRKYAPNGREIVLYRVSGGQSCVLTTSCLIDHETYSAEGITETPVMAAAIPRATFEYMLETSPVFSRYVLSIYSSRISDLMMLVEEIAFRKMDARLADYLVQMSIKGPIIHATHSEIAGELGTVREVVSRLLKDFEHRGCCKLRRGQIEVMDVEQLSTFAKAL